MESGVCYVYILRLSNGAFYVGSTRDLEKRLGVHFESGGAAATKESKPIAVEKVYRFQDCFFGRETARLRFEVYVASEFAAEHGMDMVRGAKHGQGWNSQPSRNDLRFIRRFRRFFETRDGKAWLESVIEIDGSEFDALKAKFSFPNPSDF